MIKLDIQDYCQHCTEFEVEVEQSDIYSIGTFRETLTCIKCKHRFKCKNIEQYLEKNMKGNFVL